ncbi:hypothetical protein [Methylobacterium sp. Leaf100]|uniref:hypothetical protein n=1 Tax=Methylobacterium sp. Leaf100 TaxID=1736252 RepID=UPI0012E215E9|nr:hypothetical protein [Methylobacterium sp. Leaf100]
MSGPPSAEPDGTPHYRAMGVGANGEIVSKSEISALGDDEAKAKAQALVDGHAIDLWDDLRFIEHFAPMPAKA